MSDSKISLLTPRISNERNKKTITDAFQHCLDILRENDDYFPDNTNDTDTISRRSALYGFEMFEFIKKLKENLETNTIDSKDFIKLEPIIKKEKNIIVKSEEPAGKDRISETKVAETIEKPEKDRVIKTETVEPTKEQPEENKTVEIEEPNRRRYETRNKNRARSYRFDAEEEEASELESNEEEDCDDSDNDESFVPSKRRRRNGRRKVITDDDSDSDSDDFSGVSDASDDPDDVDDKDGDVDDSGDDVDDEDGDDVDDSDSDNEDSDGDEEKSPQSRKKWVAQHFSMEEKKKIVGLVKKHPNWSLRMINKHSGCRPIKYYEQLSRFKKHVEIGGCRNDKVRQINAWVYDKYLEHCKENENFNEGILRKWGLQAREFFFPNSSFKKKFTASRSWMRKFKKDYKLIGPASNIPIDRELLKTNNNDDEVLSSDSEMKNRNRKRIIKKAVHVPLEVKAKAVELANKNPKWTLEKLRKKSKCSKIRSRQELDRWAEQIKKGGSLTDKRKILNDWVYAKCVERKKNGGNIDNEMLREWSLEAYKTCFPDASRDFRASQEWLYGFKKSYNFIGVSPYLELGKRKEDSQSKDDIEDEDSHEFSDVSDNEEERPKKKAKTSSSVSKVTNKKSSKNEKNSDMVLVKRLIPYEDKVKIVKLARDNPTWTIAMLRKATGCRQLRWMKQIDIYEQQIKEGGSRLDKIQALNDCIFQKCFLYQKNRKENLTHEKIIAWRSKAIKTIERFQNLNLKHGSTWLFNFKSRYNITGTNDCLVVPDSIP